MPAERSSAEARLRIFIAGIMQGSHVGAVMHHQGYRERLTAMLAEAFPHAEIYDPLADHRQSLTYDDDLARQVFFQHIQLCREVDMVVAYLPEASLGTAIEMWEAHHHGRRVLTISPLKHNWAVKFLSDHVYSDLDDFAAALASGRAQRLLWPGDETCGHGM